VDEIMEKLIVRVAMKKLIYSSECRNEEKESWTVLKVSVIVSKGGALTFKQRPLAKESTMEKMSAH
jgi:hypothetical protein